jgi:hypothetical protein
MPADAFPALPLADVSTSCGAVVNTSCGAVVNMTALPSISTKHQDNFSFLSGLPAAAPDNYRAQFDTRSSKGEDQ